MQQPARYVFQLRRNIALEGDLQLAELELSAFLPGELAGIDDLAATPTWLPELRSLDGFGAVGSHARPQGRQGYAGNGPLDLLPTLVRRVSFVQRLYCVTDDTESARCFIADLHEQLGPVLTWHTGGGRLVVQALPHYAIIELSEVVARQAAGVVETKRNLDALLDALLGRPAQRHALQLAEKALRAGSTTSHLSHDIHYYKAKFFPRLVRSLLNVCERRLGPGPHRALDNFAGSGTTLLEASLLGIPSVGLDLDPLSVMIASAKLDVLQLDAAYLAGEADNVLRALRGGASGARGLLDEHACGPAEADIIFPAWLMKNRRMSREIAAELNRDLRLIKAGIAVAAPEVQLLLRVLLSDTIARKLRMRFLGTGVGRFALSFAATPMVAHFSAALQRYVSVAANSGWLRETLHIPLADAQVVTADTRRIPDEIGRFDILITSPPYLPAASGRESYTKARAPSLIALGMRRHDDVDLLVDETIGSMDGSGADLEALNPAERSVVDWLAADELRAIKAAPTARYFLDMRASFAEMHRVLAPGARAVVVSGKQSTFYRFSTREPLYVADSARLLAAEAAEAGFEIEALIDVQLDKANRNARPRSRDAYYETLIMLRRP